MVCWSVYLNMCVVFDLFSPPESMNDLEELRRWNWWVALQAPLMLQHEGHVISLDLQLLTVDNNNRFVILKLKMSVLTCVLATKSRTVLPPARGAGGGAEGGTWAENSLPETSHHFQQTERRSEWRGEQWWGRRRGAARRRLSVRYFSTGGSIGRKDVIHELFS